MPLSLSDDTSLSAKGRGFPAHRARHQFAGDASERRLSHQRPRLAVRRRVQFQMQNIPRRHEDFITKLTTNHRVAARPPSSSLRFPSYHISADMVLTSRPRLSAYPGLPSPPVPRKAEEIRGEDPHWKRSVRALRHLRA